MEISSVFCQFLAAAERSQAALYTSVVHVTQYGSGLAGNTTECVEYSSKEKTYKN